MTHSDSRVTIHMAASLDGFIARTDGSVDWLETSDYFDGGDNLDPSHVEAFLGTIDCYVMGSRTYETALGFDARSVVVTDVPAYAIVGGNPARIIRERFEPDKVRILEALAWWDWPVQEITRHLALIVSGDVEALRRIAE
jgi:hypothetical protein